MKLKFQTLPNPILRQKSKPVVRIDKKIKQLAKEMLRMIKDDCGHGRVGVGLSAVQIGKPIQIFVVSLPEEKKDRVFVNPKIVWRSKEMTKGLPDREEKHESCLSAPDYFGLVKRHQSIKLTYTNLNGQEKTESFSGSLATVIQHEMDHVNGKLFIDRVLKQKAKLYQIEKE